ncbi:putative protein phosphatase 2C 71 [Babesia sp. Xinjiang]|uniref:putative protein phosphatase 2C 71 n=1 Tax=Babesia sp. Xinjiang TaxID=462227 RepID=UPI000A224D3B|nr:putative protein phosphatase 2C 71 [Babesia sp. Xinjiang]ORM41470.1 putative protein phosphatase 2C 71 [Babesia sp. Xinjiang]
MMALGPPPTSEESAEDLPEPTVLTRPLDSTNFGYYSVSAHTDIGDRKTQEDRFVIAPNLGTPSNQVAFFGIFDGTVGHLASETIHKIIVRHLVSTAVWSVLLSELERDRDDGSTIPALAVLSLSQAYTNADEELLGICHQENNDYSSCTSVTVLVIKNYTVVAHLGDSRAALCYQDTGKLYARFITKDHKPDMPAERCRILASGGSVQFLSSHNNKPFLRGGDFLERKSKGDQPMQIQYSRAFGGKDLKIYGLSSEPDISVIRRGDHHRAIVLGTDGLWDTCDCNHVFSAVFQARSNGVNPSRHLVDSALKTNRRALHRSDNITAIVVFFE